MLLSLLALAATAPAPDHPDTLTRLAIRQVAPSDEYTFLADGMDPAILPKSERAAGVQGRATFRVANDAAGTITACEPIDESALPGVIRRLCAELRKKQPLPVRYRAPGEPIADERQLSFEWSSEAWHPPVPHLAPPAPPAPPSAPGWPAFFVPTGINATFGGKLDPLFTAPPGQVGVRAVVNPKVAAPDCHVLASSGSSATDDAACQVVRTLRFAYDKPCEDCYRRSVPLIIVADGRQSRVVFPSVEGYSLARRASLSISDKSRRAILSATGGGRATLSLKIDVDAAGRVASCQSVDPVSPALAAAACRMLQKDARYAPAVDVFGNRHPSVRIEHLRVEP